MIALYLLANVAYLVTLPLSAIQTAPSDRVGTATLEAVLPGLGATLMAVGIMISTFGCNNGLILAGARAYYAMARDGLFFAGAGRLNDAKVPAWGLLLQGLWAGALVLPRTYNPATRVYGNLYGNLLDYVISAALIFYILTIAGIFRLRSHTPRRAAALQGLRLSAGSGALHRRRRRDPVRALRLSAGHHLARTGHCAPGFAGVLRVEQALEAASLPTVRLKPDTTSAGRSVVVSGFRPESLRSDPEISPRSRGLWR